MLLDQKRLGETLYGGDYVQTETIPWQFISDEPLTFDKFGPYYQFDPAQGKKLLIEAGIPNGKVNIQSPFVIGAFSGGTLRAQALQALYKEQGINLNIELMDAVSFGPWYRRRVYEDLIDAYRVAPDFNLHWYAQNKFKIGADQNSSFIEDPEV